MTIGPSLLIVSSGDDRVEQSALFAIDVIAVHFSDNPVGEGARRCSPKRAQSPRTCRNNQLVERILRRHFGEPLNQGGHKSILQTPFRIGVRLYPASSMADA